MKREAWLRLAGEAAFSVPTAWFFIEYLNLFPRLPAMALCLGLLLFGLRRLRLAAGQLCRKQKWGAVIFSLLLAVAVILGEHIHTEDPYNGLLTENYILPYSLWDLAALPFLTGGFAVLLANVLLGLNKREQDGAPEALQPVLKSGRFWPVFALLALAWLPYLLHYMPGFILGDSLGSLRQALGLNGLDNRNPVAFTLLLRFCLFLGGAFSSGDITLGCLIFSAGQLLLCAAALAYLVCWLGLRMSLSRSWRLLLALLYAFSPYVAQNSLAMWKDPIFACAVVLLTLKLTDFCLSGGAAAGEKRWLAGVFLLALLTLFSRNNGVTALLMTLAVLAIPVLRRGWKRAAKPYKKLLAVLAAALLLWGAITGPVYRAVGIGGVPREESAGLMLNQMARVAAYRGDVSEEESRYLNEILPLEKYPVAYRPCCVDLLKWDEDFRGEALYGRRLYTTWFSLLLKNPGRYLEAWELESYGFWAVNLASINRQAASISYGNPYNLKEQDTLELGEFCLRFAPVLRGETWDRLLPADDWSIPLGILNWFLLLLTTVLLLTGRKRLLPALAPSLGIVCGMLLGTPIWYLPRYELPLQLLFPLFLLLLLQPALRARAAQRNRSVRDNCRVLSQVSRAGGADPHRADGGGAGAYD